MVCLVHLNDMILRHRNRASADGRNFSDKQHVPERATPRREPAWSIRARPRHARLTIPETACIKHQPSRRSIERRRNSSRSGRAGTSRERPTTAPSSAAPPAHAEGLGNSRTGARTLGASDALVGVWDIATLAPAQPASSTCPAAECWHLALCMTRAGVEASTPSATSHSSRPAPDTPSPPARVFTADCASVRRRDGLGSASAAVPPSFPLAGVVWCGREDVILTRVLTWSRRPHPRQNLSSPHLTSTEARGSAPASASVKLAVCLPPASPALCPSRAPLPLLAPVCLPCRPASASASRGRRTASRFCPGTSRIRSCSGSS